MKCRDMNPGNPAVRTDGLHEVPPSMKCRDMNPGNTFFASLPELTYVPQ